MHLKIWFSSRAVANSKLDERHEIFQRYVANLLSLSWRGFGQFHFLKFSYLISDFSFGPMLILSVYFSSFLHSTELPSVKSRLYHRTDQTGYSVWVVYRCWCPWILSFTLLFLHQFTVKVVGSLDFSTRCSYRKIYLYCLKFLPDNY